MLSVSFMSLREKLLNPSVVLGAPEPVVGVRIAGDLWALTLRYHHFGQSRILTEGLICFCCGVTS